MNVFESLGLEEPENQDAFTLIGAKCAVTCGYNKGDAVKDVIKACGLEETPDNIKLCIESMNVMDLYHKMTGGKAL